MVTCASHSVAAPPLLTFGSLKHSFLTVSGGQHRMLSADLYAKKSMVCREKLHTILR